MPAKRGPKSPMTKEHKAALAQGRLESRSVKDYLEALEAHKPKRGRKRTSDSVQRRLDTIEAELLEADPLSRVQLIQEQMDLTNELAGMDDGFDMQSLEDAFVEVAASYSERKGITYAAWRAVGVDAAVLKRAGVSRSGY